ncbi:MAG: amidase [Pseudomonadota bacterium]
MLNRYVVGLLPVIVLLGACSRGSEPEAASAPADNLDERAADVALIPEEGDLIRQPLATIAAALKNGDTTSEALVERYLARIDAVDRGGPRLQSIIALNPDALADARARDQQRADGEDLGPLHGVPVLLKDNIESLDNVATTAGAMALSDNVTGRDAPLVAGLRAAGAVILGKTNLSQWANFRSSDSISGWSALGGQVRNPHMLDRSPCGSSSGSGAAVAAWLGAAAVGTETNGSIICPSQVNGIVGFKPTVGLVSQQFIVPISSSQDTAGPMTRSVTGAALMLDAMDTADVDYVAALDANALAGARVGVLRFAEGSNDEVIKHFNAVVETLEQAGATLVEIDEFERDPNYGRASFDVLLYEFKATLNEYLADTPEAVSARTLDDVIAFNEAQSERELALFGQDLMEQAAAKGDLDDARYAEALELAQKVAGQDGLDAFFAEHELDVVISPSGPVASRIDPINGDVWPAWAGAGWMAAVAGYPHATVPMGTVHGIPVGVSFMGTSGDDSRVLSLAFAYEQLSQRLPAPRFLSSAMDRAEIAEAMTAPK